MMNKVLHGFYVGSYRDSKDLDQLRQNGITHILAIHDTARKLFDDKEYLCILAADTPSQNLLKYFPICNDFIHEARLQGGQVLVHWLFLLPFCCHTNTMMSKKLLFVTAHKQIYSEGPYGGVPKF
ncbi:dual specificity protein phosphatase 22-like isoform X2 [Artemia franciscana]|uniref:dual specificity protein phosphatase 22-like isoform X2 n=1 Tax=Artemia franciscana TaxID=6661 RepID=UPI0032DB130B